MEHTEQTSPLEKNRHSNRKWYGMYLLLIAVLAALILFFNWFTNYFS